MTVPFSVVLLYRWATQGFDFLQAIEPAFISALPEDDFLVWMFFLWCLFVNTCEAISRCFAGILFIKQHLNTGAVLKQLLLYITVDAAISSVC